MLDVYSMECLLLYTFIYTFCSSNKYLNTFIYSLLDAYIHVYILCVYNMCKIKMVLTVVDNVENIVCDFPPSFVVGLGIL